MKKAISMILAICMILGTAVLGVSADAAIDWTQSEIVLNNAADFAEFAAVSQDKHAQYNTANGYDVTFAGKTVKLGADIDMKDIAFFSRNAEGEILSDCRIAAFAGTFDGQNKKITNLISKDEYAAATSEIAISVFLKVVNGATFRNVTFDGIKLDTVALARFSGFSDDGGNSGKGVSATVINCTVKNIVVNATNKDAGFTFGGFSWKFLGKNTITNCHVENAIFNVEGSMAGGASGRSGGFLATGAEGGSVITGCSVKNLTVNATIGGKEIGGFIAGTGGATFSGCNVEDFVLNCKGSFNNVGGFIGRTAGGGWGFPLLVNDCNVKGFKADVETITNTSGGFFGYIDNGGSKSVYENCTAEGSIECNRIAGGFAGGVNMSRDFTMKNCFANVDVNTTGTAGGFVAKMTNVDKAKFVIKNCSCAGDVTGVEDAATIFVDSDSTTIDGIIGGTYSFNPEDGDANNMADGYRALENGDGTYTVFNALGKKVVKVTFYRLNDNGEYEAFRTVEVFEGASFTEKAHNNAASKDDYRFDSGLADMNAAADEFTPDHYSFKLWATEPFGNILALDNSTKVNADMNVYAQYDIRDFKVTYQFDGQVPSDATVPAAKEYKPGETVPATAPMADVEGYKFMGWDTTEAFVMPAKDVVITGTWKKIAASSIEGNVSFNGNLTAGQFTFALLDEANNQIATTTNDANGNFSFAIKHIDAGTYTYKVTQIAGSDIDINYDTKIVEVFVVVDNEGGMAIAGGKVSFNNRTVNAATKSVGGMVYLDGEGAGGFDFVLTDKRGNVIATATSSANGSFSFGKLSFRSAGNNTYYIKQVVPANDNTVKYDTSAIQITISVIRNNAGYSSSLTIIGRNDISFYNTHKHTEVTVEGKAPTCTETGLTDGVICSGCGEILAAQEEIAALGHTEAAVEGKAATCTESGLTEGVICTVCGEILAAQEEIAALGHTEAAVEGKAATCTETGLTDGVKCSVCGEILAAQEEIAALGHTAGEAVKENEVAPTTTEYGSYDLVVYCTVCSEEISRETYVVDMLVPETTEPEEEITEPEIPLAPNPETGDGSVVVIALAIASIALAVLCIKRREVIED